MITNNLIYKGSVKDIYKSKNEKHVIFSFSDRYSIFDWGEMPDLIEDKGKALSLMGAFFFEMLGNPQSWSNWNKPNDLSEKQNVILKKFCENGINHHYIKMSDEIDYGLEVLKIDVPNVGNSAPYNYDLYKKEVVGTLVPLEVVFRFGVPVGSSLVNRRENTKIGDLFETPLIEFSSKLEAVDRYMTKNEAMAISGLTENEMVNLIDMTTLISFRLKDFFLEYNIELWDGKFEFAFGKNRELLLVDSIGPDELRLIFDGESLSKEYLRQYYSNSSWKKTLKETQDKNIENIKDHVLNNLKDAPLNLNQEYKQSFSELYKSLTNLLYGEKDKKFNTIDFLEAIKKIKNNKNKRSL